MSRIRTAGTAWLAMGISAACLFAGCSASVESAQRRGSTALVQDPQMLVQQAREEREVALAEAGRAIIDYCRATSESFGAEQECIAARQLQLDDIRRRYTPSGLDATFIREDHHGESEHVLQCHGNNRRTTCDRLHPVIAELMLRGPNRYRPQ